MVKLLVDLRVGCLVPSDASSECEVSLAQLGGSLLDITRVADDPDALHSWSKVSQVLLC